MIPVMFKCAVFATVVLTSTSCATGGGLYSAPLSGLAASKVIADAESAIGSSVDRAVAGGDYLVEKAGRTADALLQTTDYVIGKNIDTTFEKLNRSQQALLIELHGMSTQLNKLEGGILQLEDFIALDLQSALNQIPFKSDVYLMRSIEGFALNHKPTGTHRMTLTGNCFGPEFAAKVEINGKSYGAAFQLSTRANQLTVEVPAVDIANLFNDTEVVRVPIKIECKANGKSSIIYDYEGVILLLPRFPYKYTLEESWIGSDWSSELFGVSNTRKADGVGRPKGGVKGENPHRHTTLMLTAPAGCRLERGSIRWGGGSGWGRWDTDEHFTDGDRRVERRYKSWYEHVSEISAQGKYRKLVDTTERTAAKFDRGEDGLLSFGLATAPLHDRYQGFDLTLKAFNGDSIRITPSSSQPSGVRVRVESDGKAHRLSIEIANPYE